MGTEPTTTVQTSTVVTSTAETSTVTSTAGTSTVVTSTPQSTTVATSTPQSTTGLSTTVETTPDTSGSCAIADFEADDNGNCFKVVTTKLNWSKANKACKDLGDAILATIEDSTACDFIKGKLSANSWIGATDVKKDGKWKWTNGDTFDFNKWKDSSDIKNEDEDCAYIMSSSKWLYKIFHMLSVYTTAPRQN